MFAAIKRLVKLDIAAATVEGFEPQHRASTSGDSRPQARRRNGAPRSHSAHGGHRHGAGRGEHRDPTGRQDRGHGHARPKAHEAHRRPGKSAPRPSRQQATLG